MIVAKNHNSAIATACSLATPLGARSIAMPPSRTPTPLMLIGTTMASITSGTTTHQTDSGNTTPSPRAISDTPTALPSWMTRLQATAAESNCGRI